MKAHPVIASDPGKNGAIVWGTSLDDVTWGKTPDTLEGLWSLHEQIRDQFLGQVTPIAWIERNTGYMAGITRRNSEGGEEAGGVSPKAMFVFGRVTGSLEMAQVAAGFHVRRASPIKWMNAAGIITGRKKFMSASQWKNILKQECVTRFDGILLPKQITLINCDALLIYHTVMTGRLR